MIIVTLTTNEVLAAAMHALVRRAAKLNGERSREDRVKPDDFPWDNEIEADCGELALCKYLGIFWTGLGSVGAPDAGPWEARWTRHFDTGHLLIYTKDPDDQRYVLIDGVAPIKRLIGWLCAGEGKDQRWWSDEYGCWMVPRARLRNCRPKEMNHDVPDLSPGNSDRQK